MVSFWILFVWSKETVFLCWQCLASLSWHCLDPGTIRVLVLVLLEVKWKLRRLSCNINWRFAVSNGAFGLLHPTKYKHNITILDMLLILFDSTSFHMINMFKLILLYCIPKTVTAPLRWWVRSCDFLHLGDDCHRRRFSRPWHQRHNLDWTILVPVENTSFHTLGGMYPTSN